MVGRKPRISLEEGIATLIDYLRKTRADFARMLAERKTFNWER